MEPSAQEDVYTVKSGTFKGKRLTQLPAWMLKFMVKNHVNPRVRQGAIDVLHMRSRMGIPEKVKSKVKKVKEQAEMPLHDDKIAKSKPEKVDYQVQNANLSGQDEF